MKMKKVVRNMMYIVGAGLAALACNNGSTPLDPVPEVCTAKYDSLALVTSGGVQMGPALALDSIKKLIVTDNGITVLPMQENQVRPYSHVKKIVFKTK